MQRYEFTPEDDYSIYTQTAYRATGCVYHWNMPVRPDQLGEVAALPVYGAFVSFKRVGQLRSCMGTLGPNKKLAQAINDAAKSAALEDPRFPEIAPAELPFLEMEVWILWEPEPIEADPDNVIIGKHGLIASRGRNRGLLLPSVATEYKMDPETFLSHTCMKAGLPANAWRDGSVKFERFEGHLIKGDFPACAAELQDDNQIVGTAYGPQPNARHIAALADFTRQKALAIFKGRTESAYLPGAFDGNVHGALVRMKLGSRGQYLESVRISLQNTIPFQTTVLELTKAICSGVKQQIGKQDPPENFVMGLAVFFEPAKQGTAANFDPSGIKTSDRGIFVSKGGAWAFAYDPKSSPEILLDRALKHAGFDADNSVDVYSMRVISTEPLLLTTNVPSAQQLQKYRTPVVAGKFYPADGAECKKLVETLFKEAECPKDQYAAAIIPHAGWMYSARLAIRTLAKIEFPQRVVIFCPKHTGMGVDMAVAPQEKWILPTGAVDLDQDFARRLVKECDMLQLDSEAHRNEPSIEAILPFIASQAPSAQYTAIAIGGAIDYEKIDKLSDQLAAFFSKLKTPPLFIVSSDMNHYADVDSTVIQDEKAMNKIEKLDPEGLFSVCRKENVSMCGVAPAALVMATLKKMHLLHEAILVGHTNSAVISGDNDHCVGYCGYLFK